MKTSYTMKLNLISFMLLLLTPMKGTCMPNRWQRL